MDISYSLISAVREGELERVKALINTFGLSYSQAWSEGYVLLRDAVENNHTEVSKVLLTNGSKVNSKNKKPSNTPLHFAVINGDIEIVAMLLNRGANIDAKNQYGKTPYHNAVESKNMEIIELFLNRGADVKVRNNNSATLLHVAVETGGDEKIIRTLFHNAVESKKMKIIKSLLNRGADVNAKNSNNITPLHLAVEKNSEEIIKLLLSRGANVDAKGKDGTTSLHIAAEKGYLQIVEHLLKHGAHVNSACTSTSREGYTPLYLAVGKGYEKVVKLLLEYGAIVDAQDKNGKTVLHFAVGKGRPVIIDHILKHCPDVNNISNRNALNAAVHDYGEEYGKIVANLLQYGFTVNPEDVNNCKLLHAAVENGYLKIVEGLLKYGTNVNMFYNSTFGTNVNMFYYSRLGKGYMPLHVAIKNKHDDVAKLLISYGADVNAQDQIGKAPIFYAINNADLKITKLLLTNKANVKNNPELLNIAVKKECKEIVEVLLQHGADVNISDKYGRTALHFTAGEDGGYFPFRLRRNPDINPDIKGEIAKLLLSRGASVNAQTKNGITTLHAATKKGYVKVVEALLEYNADVNSTVENDITPLHLSAQKGNEVISKMLLNKGANINSKQKDGITALHIATQEGHKKVVEVLLKCGGKVDSKDEYGRTALHIASNKRHAQIVIALLEHGSDINIISKNNHTPLDFAMADISSSFDNEVNNYYSDDDYYDPRHDYYYDPIRSCEEIVEILKHHIVKMKTANLYVSGKNLLSIDSNYEVRGFQNKCEKEMASMRSEKIGNSNTSFYDILTKSINQLAILLENESVVQILKSDDYKIKFPIYASMINSHFRKGERRKELLEQVNKNCYSIFPELPYDCTQKVLSYLSDEDLRTLIDAQPTNVSSSDTNVDNVVL